MYLTSEDCEEAQIMKGPYLSEVEKRKKKKAEVEKRTQNTVKK